VLVSVLMMWKAQPADYSSYPLYNIAFGEILPHSTNVGRTLADLGLDDSYRSCIGKNAFQPDSGMFDPAFQRRFIERLSYGKLAVFYTRHPAVAYQTLLDGLSEAGAQIPFGYFDVSTGYPPYTESRAFAWWSDVKRCCFYHHGSAFLFTFLALVTLLGVLLWRRRERLPGAALPAACCLAGAALTEMCLATLCDSTDTTRHGTIFLALFDMIALACVYVAISSVFPRLISKTLAGSGPGVSALAPADARDSLAR